MGMMLALTILLLVPMQFSGVPGEASWQVSTWPFLVLYGLLGAGLIACEVPRIASLARWVSRTPSNPARIAGSVALVTRTLDGEDAQRRLRRAGYRRTVVADDAVWGVRNRWAPLGDPVFHLGLVLLLVGMGASALRPPRTTTTAAVESGPQATATTSGPDPAIDLSAIVPGYRLRSVEASMVGSTTVEMSATVIGPAGELRNLSPGAPLLLSAILMVGIDGWGYAPTLSITASGGVTPALRMTRRLPVQHELEQDDADPVLVAGRQYLLSIMLDKEWLGQNAFDSRRPPTLMVEVSRREDDGTYRVLLRNAPITLGETVDAGPITVRLDEVRAFATLNTTRSWATPLVVSGLLAVLVGLLMRLVFVRTEAVVRSEGTGSAVVVKADVFRFADAEAERLARAMERR